MNRGKHRKFHGFNPGKQKLIIFLKSREILQRTGLKEKTSFRQLMTDYLGGVTVKAFKDIGEGVRDGGGNTRSVGRALTVAPRRG